MSVKQSLRIITAGFTLAAAASALAGGPDHMAPPVPAFEPSAYIEANVGYAESEWSRLGNNVAPAGGTLSFANSDDGAGFTGGVAAGYQFKPHLAVEMGWQYLPENKATVASASLELESWFVYGAFKVIVPLVQHLDIFGKLGVAYRDLSYSGPGKGASGFSDDETWNAYLAAGLQYGFKKYWYVTAQYARVPGCHDFSTAGRLKNESAPSADLYTVSIGYYFKM